MALKSALAEQQHDGTPRNGGQLQRVKRQHEAALAGQQQLQASLEDERAAAAGLAKQNRSVSGSQPFQSEWLQCVLPCTARCDKHTGVGKPVVTMFELCTLALLYICPSDYQQGIVMAAGCCKRAWKPSRQQLPQRQGPPGL